MASTSAVLYARISLDSTDDQTGVDRQEAACREWARSKGLTVTAVHTDNSISASKDQVRPAFEALLRDRPPAVVVWHLDRLLRKSTRDLERVLDLGCTVHSLQGGDFDLSTPTGRALARTVVAWSQNEVELKGERQRAANRQRVMDGRVYGRKRAWGWLDLECQEVDPVAAGLIVEAVEGILAGMSLRDVAAAWNRVSTAPGGKPWLTPTVRSTLLRPINAGVVAYREEEHREVVPRWTPLISVEQYDALRAVLASRGLGTGSAGVKARKYLMGGLAHCEGCGSTMQGTVQKTGVNYLCSGRAHGCYRAIRVATLDRFVLRWTALSLLNRDPAEYLPAVSVERLQAIDAGLRGARADRAEIAALGGSVASRAALMVEVDRQEVALRSEAADLTRDSAIWSLVRELTGLTDSGDVDADSRMVVERVEVIIDRLTRLSLGQQRLLVRSFGAFTVRKANSANPRVGVNSL